MTDVSKKIRAAHAVLLAVPGLTALIDVFSTQEFDRVFIASVVYVLSAYLVLAIWESRDQLLRIGKRRLTWYSRFALLGALVCMPIWNTLEAYYHPEDPQKRTIRMPLISTEPLTTYMSGLSRTEAIDYHGADEISAAIDRMELGVWLVGLADLVVLLSMQGIVAGFVGAYLLLLINKSSGDTEQHPGLPAGRDRLSVPSPSDWEERLAWCMEVFEPPHAFAGYSVSVGADRLVIELTLAYCSGAWISVITLATASIDAYLREFEVDVSPHASTYSVFESAALDESYHNLRKYRNRLVHDPASVGLSADSFWEGEPGLHEMAKSAVQLTAKTLFMSPML